MQITVAQWVVAVVFSVAAHAALTLAWQTRSEGAVSPPQGPAVAMADSLAAVLGQAVDIESDQLEPTEVEREEVVEDVNATEPDDTVEPNVEQQLAVTKPVEALRELNTDPDLPNVSAEDPKPEKSEDRPARRRESQKKQSDRTPKKRTESQKRKRAKKRASRRGSDHQGSQNSRSGGGGRSRASPGQIATFKSQVRARIAACVRRRVGGGQRGRATVRFRVSSGGGATGVSASGTSGISSAAASAARGCSFPRPPAGAAGLRFAFPVSVR